MQFEKKGRMRLVGLISGGKDSVYNMLQCIKAGHEIVAVANIEPERKGEVDSYMYQSVGQEVVSLVAGALGLPIFRHKTAGKAMCLKKNYVRTSQDEVENLLELLSKVNNEMNIEGVSVGTIASDYQRTRVENVCSRLGLKCFAYLWKRDQAELLQEMIDNELDAIIIKVACIGLHPDLHLGMHIKDLQPHLLELNQKFGVNICGEGGEYETLTLDSPLYHRLITITGSEKVILSDDAFAPVGFLNVTNATLEPKNWEDDDPVQSLQIRLKHIQSIIRSPYSYVQDCVDEISEILYPQKPVKRTLQDLPFPFESEIKQTSESSKNLNEYWKSPSSSSHRESMKLTTTLISLPDITNCNLSYLSGWCCIGNVIGSTLMNAMQCLQKYLERIQYEFESIVFVNLFVKDLSEFVSMNKIYSQFMPEVLPPARCCVETDLPLSIGVIMTVVAHKFVSKSQKALHPSSFFSNKDALHVQSISHWAPANIGPYSQCIKVGEIYYLAGQIPLIPGTMEILNKPIFHQCRLTLRHVLRILQAMDSNLNFSNIFQAVCYVTSHSVASDVHALWSYITNTHHTTVAAIVVSKLPKNAQMEWEVIACHLNDPQVTEVNENIEDFNIDMKRCVYMEPFTSSLTCKIGFLKKVQKRSLKLFTPTELNLALKRCIQFIRADFKTVGIPLCMFKLFYKASESSVALNVHEIVKSFTDYKIVMTAIPVVGCEDPDVFLIVTGVCH